MKIIPRILIALFILVSFQVFAVSPPKPRSRAEIQTVLEKAPKINQDKLRKINVVLVADARGGYKNGEHCYPLWIQRWILLLGGTNQASDIEKQVNLYGGRAKYSEETFKGAKNVTVTPAWVWPTKEQLKTADLIVKYAYGKWNDEMANDLKTYLSRGGGFVLVHPAVVIPKGKRITDEVTKLTGLAFEWGYSHYRHGPVELEITAKDHPICLGLPDKIRFMDEPYWPLKGDKSKITILATSDEKIGEDSDEKKPEPIFWTHEYGKGRVFGCILGHYSWTFDDPYFRILLLRGMAWAAGESPYRFDQLVLRGIPLSD